jgi:hypothetical protein
MMLRVPPFLVHSRSEDSGFLQPAWDGASPIPGGEFCWRHVAQCCVRPALIVLPSPSLDLPLSVFQAQEPIRVQAFFPQPAVERFHVRVVGRLSWSAEIQRYSVSVSPSVQSFRNEFRAVVHANRFRHASLGHDPFQYRRNLLPLDALAHSNRQTFACEVINNGQRAEPPSIKQRIRNKIHRPAVIRTPRLYAALPVCRADMSPWPLDPHAEAFLPVDPIHPLMVDPPSLAAQQNIDSKITVAHSYRGNLLDPHPQGGLVRGCRSVTVRRPLESKRPATPALTYPITLLQMPHQISPPARP